APEGGLEEFLYIFSFPFIYPIFDFIDVPCHVRGKITAFGKIPAHFQIRVFDEWVGECEECRMLESVIAEPESELDHILVESGAFNHFAVVREGFGFIADEHAGKDRKSTRLNSSHVSISYA